MFFELWGRRGRDRLTVGFAILLAQSVPITPKIMSSNLAHGKVYYIQNYVIKFISDLAGRWLFQGTSSTNKTDHHDI